LSPILLDTGPLVAILFEPDAQHEICTETLRRIRAPLLTCWPVITEAAWLLRASPHVVEKLLASFNGQPLYLARLDESDLDGIASILSKYSDLGLQVADASLVHLANREAIDTVFTLDRRDFSIVRLPRGRKLRLIP
jgi:uncharacterized protein